MRGYYGIGVYHPKTEMNIGTLLRSSFLYNANFLFTIGRRYQKQSSDTTASWRHIPLYNYKSFDQFKNAIPYSCQLICVELTDKASDLRTFVHPERAIYLLGAEDYGIPERITKKHQTLKISYPNPKCSLNVAVAGSIIMYDRYMKEVSRHGKESRN